MCVASASAAAYAAAAAATAASCVVSLAIDTKGAVAADLQL